MSDDNFKFRDLGVEYTTAAHAVQTGILTEMQFRGVVPDANPAINMMKHLRTGVDLQKAETAGLVFLLIKAGLFTLTEYQETMRLAVNEEAARYTDHINEQYGAAFGGQKISLTDGINRSGFRDPAPPKD